MGASWNHAARMDLVQMLAGLLSGATDPRRPTPTQTHTHARPCTPPRGRAHAHAPHPHPLPRKQSFPTVVPGAFPCACPQHFVEARASPQRTLAPPPAGTGHRAKGTSTRLGCATLDPPDHSPLPWQVACENRERERAVAAAEIALRIALESRRRHLAPIRN